MAEASPARTAILHAESDRGEAPPDRQAAIDRVIAGDGGRRRQAGGGPMIVAFADPAAAVHCAALMQQHLAADPDEPDGAGPAWRIAVGLGDDELAPLIAAAGPGEVRITVALYALVRSRLAVGVAPLEAPAGGFRVLADPSTAPRRVWLYQAGALHNTALVLVVVLLVAAMGVMFWHLVLAPGGP